MTSLQQKGIPFERIHSQPSINIENLDCCICRDILWKPIACQMCETPFCSPCMDQWLAKNPSKCPYQCETYTERKCPPFIAKLLSQLQITCFYQSNGCEQISSYEALDKHELGCDYQPKQCPGCQSNMLKKDFLSHKSTCDLIKLTCKECKFMYKRSEGDAKHTEMICLKKQLKRLKRESKESKNQIEKLNSQLTQINKSDQFLTAEKITFADLPTATFNLLRVPNKYKELQWTDVSYMHESYAIKKYPNSGYVKSYLPAGSLHIAFFNGEASIAIDRPNETFTLVSFIASAAWNDNLLLTVTGHRNSVEVHYRSTVLLFGRPQTISLLWKNIDKVTFKSFGGTAHPGSGQGTGKQVILTQLIVHDLSEKQNNS